MWSDRQAIELFHLIFVLHLIVPGRWVDGYVKDEQGAPLRYRLNGPRVLAITLGLYALAYKLGYIPNYLVLGPFLLIWYPFVFSLLGPAAGESTRYGVFTGAANLAQYFVVKAQLVVFVSLVVKTGANPRLFVQVMSTTLALVREGRLGIDVIAYLI